MKRPKLLPLPAAVNVVYRMLVPQNMPGLMKERFPYDMLEIGDAIRVPRQRADLENLKTACRARNKKRDGKFFGAMALESGAFAIVRLAPPPPQTDAD